MEKVIDVVGNLKATRWGKGYHDWTFVLSTWGGGMHSIGNSIQAQ